MNQADILEIVFRLAWEKHLEVKESKGWSDTDPLVAKQREAIDALAKMMRNAGDCEIEIPQHMFRARKISDNCIDCGRRYADPCHSYYPRHSDFQSRY